MFQTDQLTIHHPQLTRLIVALKAHPRAHQAHQIVALQVLQVAAAHLQVLQAAHQVTLLEVHLPATAHQEADLPVVAALRAAQALLYSHLTRGLALMQVMVFQG